MRTLRSALFMPASNARAIEKARGLACDAVILDLEDAVAPEAKASARIQAMQAAADGGFGTRTLALRINALDSEWGIADCDIDCEIFNFNLNLLSYFDKIDLAITRSGSSMLAELLNCCIPFISIPFKFSADNHQLKNAKFYEKKKYGFLVKENEISEKLFPLIKSIHRDRNLLSLINFEIQPYFSL